MGCLKYWYISLFFIAGTAFGDENGRTFDLTFNLLKEINDIGSLLEYYKEKSVEPDVNLALKFIQNIFEQKPDVTVDYYVADLKTLQLKFCKIEENSHCQNYFRNSNQLKVLIHGFIADYKTDWIKNMARQFALMDNVTVIAIDWSVNKCLGNVSLAKNTPLYDCAFDNIGRVIDKTANFLANLNTAVKILKNTEDTPWKNIHIVGHSMGAHIAGKVAEKFTELSNVIVDRVTGLDPALPCFNGSKWMLDKSQAEFVDVIHTNSDKNDNSTLGLYKEMGHVDIYPNNGNNQPGCTDSSPRGLVTLFTCETLLIVLMRLLFDHQKLVCNHGKAAEYMITSMKDRSCDYRAVPWDDKKKLKTQTVDQVCQHSNCVKMGYNAEKPSNGIDTNTGYFINMTKLAERCRSSPLTPTPIYKTLNPIPTRFQPTYIPLSTP